MADGIVVVQPDSTGKKIDTTEITVGANTVERQRINITGLSAAAILDLLTSAPVGTEYAVPVRNIPSGTQAISHANLDVALSTLAQNSKFTDDVASSSAASETATTRLSAAAILRLLDTAQAAGSQLVAAKGDQTSGLWVNLKNSIALTANQGSANATPWNENLAQVGGTAVVTSIAGAAGIGGDTADGTADAGKSVKVGGKVTLNNAALPTALTASQRGPAMIDEYGRFRVVPNRPKILGSYKFESGRLTVLASAHASTAGFFWLINPVGSTVLVYVKKLFATSVPTAVTAFASSPRVTVERMTFTGTASGATVTPAKRDSTDAANAATLRTASTGLTITAGAVVADFTVPAVLTAVGIAVPVDQWFYDAADEDDYIILRAGEGLVVRQADAGTTSDTRLVLVFGAWEER